MAAIPPSYSELPLSLSDRLAVERTRLANERTMLAYLRTGVALVVAGFSLINFFREYIYVWIGVGLIPLGIGMIVGGYMRFQHKRERIHAAVVRGPHPTMPQQQVAPAIAGQS
ncbi:DUF202 domain-containing protein [Hymenobacter sp. GOD-10R]|uniref:DUF202 domain-containing protein n=1 Tax=Hymenobacter sp. GOD-10R TaxID=3093922 RepID=UPI002D77CDEA|nr:DUF202 domain-containing protein [Hymenobacter sp. GOD-10R]WRQ29355.1 DUF202 domain-containing protein [Hymenobacter sp. GOD-10R]